MDNTGTVTTNEQESDILQKADEADEVRRKVIELRKEKKQTLQEKATEQSSDTDSTTNKTEYVTGNVASLKEDECGHVVINVEYVLNGEVESEVFKMSLPQDPEDYSVENKYVRLRESVGVSSDQSLMGRDVPLRVEPNDSVLLDIPENPTKLNKTVNGVKRKVLSSGVYNSLKEITDNNALTGSYHAIGGSVMIAMSLFLLMNAFLTVGPEFVVDLMLSCVSLGLLLFGILAMEYGDSGSIPFSSLIAGIGGSILSYSVLNSSIPIVWISNDYTAFENTITVMQYGFAAFLLACGYIHVVHQTEGLRETIVNKVHGLKKKFQKWRGIEYVR